ncbi:cobyric acid synthase [Cloacibacillus sp.]|uniref:cobyric acid synthase n=1 Tax=Cloacibacillus sp. TaxID=2049023 RepID=UPI0025BC57BF|nr:cobyric acid synthase [Cloacibacillus sp.]MCC8057089.1 cobyric acid synthase [Cloacibacillus sp.]
MKNCTGIMIQGTSSDAGKSFITTALCRIFSDMGYAVCPFKSQNMSNNSCVTPDGLEMGRAQGVQAEAARVEPQTYMNPILLKPRKDTSSEIVLMGKVFDAPCDKNYYRGFTMGKGLETLRKALAIIDEKYEVMVCEGAGSPAEVNLNAAEIVNMRVAQEADIPVLLVADVDRGGAIASVVGTLELLGEDRRRVKGIIFNKFRGDLSLFEDAVEFTEKKTGVKVVGVMPWLTDIVIEGEDIMSINWHRGETEESNGKLRVGVVKFPRVSNHTDIEAFRFEPDVEIIELASPAQVASLDAVVLPGTKSTVLDMKYLLDSGLAAEIRRFYQNGGTVYGLCGGYQMMGEEIDDRHLRDNDKIPAIEGLGLLPVVTTFGEEKTTIRRRGRTIHPYFKEAAAVDGYEIHFGETRPLREEPGFAPLFELDGRADGLADGELRAGGSYLHNAFHNDLFRAVWLNRLRKKRGLPEREAVSTAAAKEAAYDALAAQTRKNLDLDYIIDIMHLKADAPARRADGGNPQSTEAK